MEWVKPNSSKGQRDRAGRTLIDPNASPTQKVDALSIINNLRASHYYPLNTFKVTLRRKSEEVCDNRLVAQRIKRLSSIEHKLQRYPSMNLSRMQDIGGCRAILESALQVRRLVEKYQTGDLKHSLDDIDDYIAQPKASGYRSVHLIYKYFSDKQAPSVYNGLFIEVQIRTRLQHAWATAVETVGTFLSQALKSSQGEDEWLRFFALMGSELAIREKCDVIVPNTPTSRSERKKELKHLSAKLRVEYVLQMYRQALNIGRDDARNKNNFYFLLKLEPSHSKMTIRGFQKRQLELATSEYLRVEQEISNTLGSEAVLVSVDSLQALERAYPNYFLDTHVFLDALKKATA